MRRVLRDPVVAALLVAAALMALALLFTGCEEPKPDVEHRAETFTRAERLLPEPQLNNFPSRAALIEFTERQDRVGHVYYVYIIAETGNVIGYYSASARPVNSCAFLSSNQDIWTGSEGKSQVIQTPSLDGMYYGGTVCDAWFFFDAETDALIEIRGVNFYVSDQPLRLEAEAIRVDQ